jgi:hypothetical protein
LLNFFALAKLEHHRMKLLATSSCLTKCFAKRKLGIVRLFD